MSFSQNQSEAIHTFNQMIDRGELSFERMDCLCGSSDSTETSDKDRNGLPHRVVICKSCGLIRSDPRLTDHSYELFYSSDLYRKLYTPGNFLEMADQKLTGLNSKYIFKQLSPSFRGKQGLEILEFGCGGGWNLIHFTNAGHRVTGYDYSPALVEKGKSYGLNLHVGTCKDVEGEYDAIILNHVVEHFTDLPNSMASLIKHLKPGGLMYIGVPDMDHYGKKQLQNAHVFFFTSATFQYYMSQCGLRLVQHCPEDGIAMHGIFVKGSSKPSMQSLENEYSRMLKVIRKEKIKRFVIFLLRKLRLKEPLKKLLGK